MVRESEKELFRVINEWRATLSPPGVDERQIHPPAEEQGNEPKHDGHHRMKPVVLPAPHRTEST